MQITLSFINILKNSFLLFIIFFVLVFAQDNRLRLKQANILENITIDGVSMQYLKGDVIFSATGITDGPLLKGIKNGNGFYESETLLLHKDSKTNKKILNRINK